MTGRRASPECWTGSFAHLPNDRDPKDGRSESRSRTVHHCSGAQFPSGFIPL
jgi:hypothetical protein